MSTLPRISRVVFLSVFVAACSPEQSKAIGQQPKKTVDGAAAKVGDLMQQGQGSDRLKEESK